MSFIEELEALLKEEKTLSPEAICLLIVQRWGGDSVYIPKKYRLNPSKTDTVNDLISRGVPRSTAYRRIKRRWVDSW